MTDTLLLAPPAFSGSAVQDAAEWLRQFTNYCAYKNFTDLQARNLFRVMLTGSAADWFETVVFDEDCVTLDDFKEAFLLRYRSSEVVKYKSARDIFSRKQQDDESVDSFIDKMQKDARIVGMPIDTLQLAILNGLLLHIQNFVLQKEPKTLQDLISAARLAELTIPAKKDTDASLHAKLDKMMQSIEDSKTTTALVRQGGSPTPRRVSFGDFPSGQRNFSGGRNFRQPNITFGQRGQFAQPFSPRSQNSYSYPSRFNGPPNYGNYQFRPRAVNTQPRQWGSIGPPPATPPQPRSCSKCGLEPHQNINFCPAINLVCWQCGRRGHISRVCRAFRGFQGDFSQNY